LKDEMQLLDVMIEDQSRQTSIYKPGVYWEDYCRRIISAIKANGISKFRSDPSISKGYGGYPDYNVLDPTTLWNGGNWKSRVLKMFANSRMMKHFIIDHYLRLIERHYSQMKIYRQYYYEKRFGQWFSEISNKFELPNTLVGDCRDYVLLNEKKISTSYIRHLVRLYNYSKHIDFTRIRSIFEIGGGYGANTHLLLSLYPNIKKVLYLDTPPVLYVGTQYLKSIFPTEVNDYTGTRNLGTISFKTNDEREIIPICPWQIQKFKGHIDLFWNSFSFQEMSEDIVANYSKYILRFLNKGAYGYLCLILYKTGNPNTTLSVEKILSSFNRSVSLRNMDYRIEEDTPPFYYLGQMNE